MVSTVQELKKFDIKAFSCLNLMPGSNPKKEAYFCFNIGIKKEDFLEEYEIESIILNDKQINNEDIIHKYDPNGFRFYSLNFKNNNNIDIIIRSKKTNEKYLKKFNIPTIRAC